MRRGEGPLTTRPGSTFSSREGINVILRRHDQRANAHILLQDASAAGIFRARRHGLTGEPAGLGLRRIPVSAAVVTVGVRSGAIGRCDRPWSILLFRSRYGPTIPNACRRM